MNSSSLKVAVIGAGSHVFGSSLLHQMQTHFDTIPIRFHSLHKAESAGRFL
jgi:hypothetical protein